MVEKLPRAFNIEVAHEAMLVPALMILHVISRYYSSLFLRKKILMMIDVEKRT
jgi:hypothetical protein